MNCPRCGAEARSGQRFCAECGLALSTSCPNCSAPYEPGQKFCAECGAQLHAPSVSVDRLTARASPPSAQPTATGAERRYVSILFADLVGFTPLAEDEDPEEVRDLLSRYFDVARQLIVGYGGTVEKFIGDAVMAVWGAPVAREDDPERAVRAALELVARVHEIEFGGAPLALRAGVLSGEAAVIPGRTGEGMIAGDLVNTASRLQSVAQAGVVLVGESTFQATSAAIAYEAAGEQSLKGKQAPVPAWRALRVVARVGGEGRDQGLEPPFVGRDEELRLLKDQLHAAQREHKLRTVAITGQAGIGKSRLIWELEKYLDGVAGQTYYWHQGRSPSYGEGVAFWALGEMIRQRARISEAEDEASTRAKLAAALADFVPDAQERRWLEPALGALLGIDQADWAAREQLFSAWRTFFERIADRGPAVLAFEDLQWADEGLLDFIDHLLEYARDKPILVVTLARPELLDRRPNFGMGHRALAAIHLEPLTEASMRELVRGLAPGVDEEDLAKIIERAEGVPLYAVELIRSLLDSGVCVRDGAGCEIVGPLPRLEVPPTLRALIASRLDALSADDRRLIQDASVIGQVFSVAALAAMTVRGEVEIDPRLRDLARKELLTLETDPRSPERGQYRFKQGLIREVAYATLSKRERRTLHLAAARYYDTLDDDELAGVVATHYVEAFRSAPEGAEGAAVAAQAKVALKAAGERAARLHSNVQAMTYFEQAMAFAQDEAERNDLRVRAANSAYTGSRPEHALELIVAAIDWSNAHENAAQAIALTAAYSAWLLDGSRVDDALAALTSALRNAPPHSDREQALVYGQLARAHLFRAESEQGLMAADRALETAERLGLKEALPHMLITKSWALAQVGRRAEGTALLIGAAVFADEAGEPWARNRARFNLSSFLIGEDPRKSLAAAMESVEICEQYGINSAGPLGNAAAAALLLGDLELVFNLEERAPTAANALGVFVLGYAAVAAAMRGDDAGADRRLETLSAGVRSSTSEQDQASYEDILGLVAFARGQLDEVQRRTARSVALYPTTMSAGLATVLAGHAAALARDSTNLKASIDWLDQPGFDTKWIDRSRRGLKAASAALDGRVDEALSEYRRLIDEWRVDDWNYDLAFGLMGRGVLLGDRDADSAAGLDEAREIFRGMGAEPMFERLMAVARASVEPDGARLKTAKPGPGSVAQATR